MNRIEFGDILTLVDTKGEIIHPALSDFIVKARSNTFASGIDPIKSLTIQGSEGYQFRDINDGLSYQDEYLGNGEKDPFSGFEIVRDEFQDENVVFTYLYAGGLTEEGISLGASEVNSRQRKILLQYADKVRLGGTFELQFTDKYGKWTFWTRGEETPAGWTDHEMILLGQNILYELDGTAAILVPQFRL